MSKLYMPFGAQRIMDARKGGKKPADLIIVSQVGKIDVVDNPVVQLQEGLSHDWRWAVGLELCFWTEPKFYDPVQILDCYRARPRRLMLWNWTTEQGFDVWAEPHESTIDKPAVLWQWRVERMPWTPGQCIEFSTGGLRWI